MIMGRRTTACPLLFIGYVIMTTLTPKNWGAFQHYKNRKPAWIKLHHGLLDDFTFSRLPVASKALAPLLWLLASEYQDGKITAPIDELAFRLHMIPSDLAEALSPLIDSGFFHASEPLAGCYQDASLEKRREEKIEKRKSERKARASARVSQDDFEVFWEAWPNKVGKPGASKAFIAAQKRGSELEPILSGIQRYIADKPPDRQWLNPATFLNQSRWEDRPAQVQHGKTSSVIAASDKLSGIIDGFDAGPREADGTRSAEGETNVRVLSQGRS
jgi:hypothetical protein